MEIYSSRFGPGETPRPRRPPRNSLRLFQFNVPHRWSIAHLYQAILNKEPHVNDISYLTTLAGYVHWKLTGQKVLGIGDASGMFPIDSKTNDYDASKIELFNEQLEAVNIAWKLQDILPKVLVGRRCRRGADRRRRQAARSHGPTDRRVSPSVRPRATPAPAWWRRTAWRNERVTFPQEHLSLP